MARVRKTMQIIEKSIGCTNIRYDMHINNLNDIIQASNNPCDLVCNGFRFGYMQGMKAAKAEMKKGGIVNG